MPRKRQGRRAKRRLSKNQAVTTPSNRALKSDGLEKKRFRFNNYSQITLRNSWFTTYVNQQCYVAFYADVNGYGWNLYDGLGGAIPGGAFNVNYAAVWGSSPSSGPVGSTDQFPQWANLYSLYTVESIGLRITPFSFTATGSQGPITMITGGQGIVAALIESGINLNPQVFSGALGDTKNLRMVQAFKQAKSHLNYSSLIPAEVPTTFRQTVFEGFDSGFRQLFPSRTRYGRSAGDPDVLSAQLPALVAFMPFTFNDDLSVGKALAVFQPYCDMTFMQRRTSISSLTSRAFRAFRLRQNEIELEKFRAFDDMLDGLAPRVKPAPQELPQPKEVNQCYPKLEHVPQQFLEMLSREIGSKDQKDLSKTGVHPHPGPVESIQQDSEDEPM